MKEVYILREYSVKKGELYICIYMIHVHHIRVPNNRVYTTAQHPVNRDCTFQYTVCCHVLFHHAYAIQHQLYYVACREPGLRVVNTCCCHIGGTAET